MWRERCGSSGKRCGSGWCGSGGCAGLATGVLTFAAISEVLGVRVGGRRVDVADMDHQAARE